MLVRRIAGPVSGGRDDLHHKQAFRLRLIVQNIAHIARVGARSAHLLPDSLGADQPGLARARAGRGADCDLCFAFGAYVEGQACGYIDRGWRSIEHARSAANAGEACVACGDRNPAAQDNEASLPPFLSALEALARFQPDYAEADVSPACALRGDVDERAVGGRGGGTDTQIHDTSPASTARRFSVFSPVWL